MRRLIFSLLALAPLAAGATNITITGLCGGAGVGCNPVSSPYFMATAHTGTLSGTATFKATTNGAFAFTWGITKNGTTICSHSDTSPNGTLGTFTCPMTTTSVVNGDTLRFTISGSSIIGGYLTDNPNITFTETGPCDPTASACACGNDCGGASCGTTSLNVSSQCVCNCGSSCNGTPVAPASFACQALGGVYCSWGATSGASYVLGRDGSTIYTGNTTNYTDLPSPGAHTYTVYGTGYCAPSDSVSFITGTTNPLTATATTTGTKSGAVIGCW
jgi:hypothetical protein